ncbi:MAG TPA: glycosyltransferase, partial [Desulfuromonadales bacterium]|nr:glycosyltransferase [Desulfuromonadales bacterium]
MPLRILHVLSSNFFAGSVAYAIQLAERQSADGHEVFMVTDQAGLSDSFTCLTLPISDRSLVQRFRNILFLRRLIRERNISVVHAHSRAASWVSSHAVRGTRVPLVSTIHGRQVKHSRLKSARVYGDRVIAICPNLVEHLQQEIGIDQNKLEFLPNPLDFERLKQIRRTRPDDGQVLISVVGRFNGPKGEHFSLLVQYVFPLLLEKFPRLSLQMAGGEWDSFPQAGKKAFANLCSLYGERIRFVGFTSQPLQLMADSDLVIGAGRVALEALALGTPLYALGEACCHGLITPDNLVAAIGSNFGDILSVKSPFTPDTAAIAGMSVQHEVGDAQFRGFRPEFAGA